MKEATGELNMTVVTVVAIAAVGAFFYAFVWPGIQAGLKKSTCQNICPVGSGDPKDTTVSKQGENYVCGCPDGSSITITKDGDVVGQ